MSSARAPKKLKKNIKNAGLVYRKDTPAALNLAKETSLWLTQKKVQVYSHPNQKLPKAKILRSGTKLDLMIVLGGDGTYLEAIRLLAGAQVPLLGFNMGGLGFLTPTRAQDVFDMLELAMAGELEVKSRSMLCVQVRSNGKITAEFEALNDLVIERGGQSHLLHLKLSVDQLPITPIKADGLIVATPTGSTAYNLAAGGPILHPEVDALVVTPICPHSLTSRPFVFPDQRRIQFSLVGKNQRAVLTLDGIRKAKIGPADEVVVTRAKHGHQFLRKFGHNYFGLLKEKLKFGERA